MNWTWISMPLCALVACTPSPSSAPVEVEGEVRTAETSESVPAASPSWALELPEPKADDAAPESGVAPKKVEEDRVTPVAPVQLALAHEDSETDFIDRAHEKLDRDDLVGAFVAFRKHLYDQPATIDVLLELASIGRRLGEVAVAEAALLRAETIEPSATVATELARLYFEDGKRDEAKKAAQRAVKRDPTDPAPFNQLGRIEMANSEWQRAELAFRHALELDPTEAIVHNNIGLLYVRMRRGDSAVDALATAVELFDDAAPHFVFNNLGLAQELAGNPTKAREAFEEALLVQPFYTRAKVNLERIERSLAQAELDRSVRTARLLAEPVTAQPAETEFEVEAWNLDEIDPIGGDVLDPSGPSDLDEFAEPDEFLPEE